MSEPCEKCEYIKMYLDEKTVGILSDFISTERARLSYEWQKIKTERTMCPDLVESAVERIRDRERELSEASSALFDYKQVILEGKPIKG
jgi:hypothetical protein